MDHRRRGEGTCSVSQASVCGDPVIQAGAVNKVYAFIAPKIFGGRQARSPVEGEGVDKISDALLLNGPEITRFGEDLLLEYKVR